MAQRLPRALPGPSRERDLASVIHENPFADDPRLISIRELIIAHGLVGAANVLQDVVNTLQARNERLRELALAGSWLAAPALQSNIARVRQRTVYELIALKEVIDEQTTGRPEAGDPGA